MLNLPVKGRPPPVRVLIAVRFHANGPNSARAVACQLRTLPEGPTARVAPAFRELWPAPTRSCPGHSHPAKLPTHGTYYPAPSAHPSNALSASMLLLPSRRVRYDVAPAKRGPIAVRQRLQAGRSPAAMRRLLPDPGRDHGLECRAGRSQACDPARRRAAAGSSENRRSTMISDR